MSRSTPRRNRSFARRPRAVLCAVVCGCTSGSKATPPTPSPADGRSPLTQPSADRARPEPERKEVSREDAGEVDIPLVRVRCTPEGSKKGVAAVWTGSPEPREFSPIYGMSHLRFVFDDGSVQEFVPRGWMRYGAWECNIFSPGCRFVALLLSGHVNLYPHDSFPDGYHLVEVSHLKAYFEGRERPWAIVRYSGEGGTSAVYEPFVYHHGTWTSPTEFDFLITDASNGDGWATAHGVRLRADVTEARDGGLAPLRVIPERWELPPKDGCDAADIRPPAR